MSYVWYDVLVAIAEAPGRQLRMRDLARAMLLTRSNSTRLVDKIEAAGLVARVRTPLDRRGALATLTPAGLRALRLAWPVYARGIREHFLAYLDRAEIATLTESLTRVHEGAKSYRNPGRSAPSPSAIVIFETPLPVESARHERRCDAGQR